MSGVVQEAIDAAHAPASTTDVDASFVASVASRVGSVVDLVNMRWVPETELVGTPFDCPSPAALLRRHVMNEGKALLAKKVIGLLRLWLCFDLAFLHLLPFCFVVKLFFFPSLSLSHT